MEFESSGESSGTSLPPSKESNENQVFSQDVVDMMRIATWCDREGAGDFIWVNSVPKRLHGSACILLTQDGMECIRGALESKVLRSGHSDLNLQEWLYTGNEAQRARACYLHPPIGSTLGHESHCDAMEFGEKKTRPAGFIWYEKPCWGCRVKDDPQRRTKWMYQWKSGEGDPLCKRFPDDHFLHRPRFDWKSYEEPTAFADDWLLRSNPGKTEQEKRAYRSFEKRISKRNWVATIDEAVCVVVSSSLQTLKCNFFPAHVKAFRLRVSTVVVLGTIEHPIDKADVTVSPDWKRRCYHASVTSEAALQHARSVTST